MTSAMTSALPQTFAHVKAGGCDESRIIDTSAHVAGPRTTMELLVHRNADAQSLDFHTVKVKLSVSSVARHKRSGSLSPQRRVASKSCNIEDRCDVLWENMMLPPAALAPLRGEVFGPSLLPASPKVRYFTDQVVLANVKTSSNPLGWADEEYPNEGALQRRNTWKDGALVSLLEADIRFDAAGKPCNPHEEFAFRNGRFLLGKWGPNHAADPILTTDPISDGEPFRVLVVTRGDCSLAALPGGMIDDEEDTDQRGYTRTIQREIVEEAAEPSVAVQNALANGEVIYTGYVHDPRNAKHAWIETIAVWGHISSLDASSVTLRPAADGETRSSYWMDMTENNIRELYASHPDWVRIVLRKLIAGDMPVKAS